MTYNELRYTLTMFNKWRSANSEKYEKISKYLGTKGKCLSLFEYQTNEIIKKHYGELRWNEIYRLVSNGMSEFLGACETFEELGANEEIQFIVESIPMRFGFTKDVKSVDNSSILEGL